MPDLAICITVQAPRGTGRRQHVPFLAQPTAPRSFTRGCKGHLFSVVNRSGAIMGSFRAARNVPRILQQLQLLCQPRSQSPDAAGIASAWSVPSRSLECAGGCSWGLNYSRVNYLNYNQARNMRFRCSCSAGKQAAHKNTIQAYRGGLDRLSSQSTRKRRR